MLRPVRSRPAFTLVELLLVMVVLLMLGAILVPSLLGMWSNNRTKAAVDLVAARLADARGLAIAQGQPFAVQCSADGRQVRVQMDESGQTEQPAENSPPIKVGGPGELPTGVVLTPKNVSTATADGWTTLVVFKPDGTCVDAGEMDVGEPEHPDVIPVTVRVRALTGVVTANPSTATPGGRP